MAFEDYMFFNISNIKKSHITYDGNNFAQQIPLFEHKLFESKSIHYIKTFSKFRKTLDSVINDEYSKRHIFQAWNESMMLGEKTESLNYVYFRVKNGFLDAYFHLRANDAFNFAYLNFEMFSAVFDYACIYTKKTRGRFIYTVNCYHIYKCDQKKYITNIVILFLSKIKLNYLFICFFYYHFFVITIIFKSNYKNFFTFPTC